MAPKYRKIKRQKLHYRKRHNNIWKTILFVVLILVLIFLAYSVAGPVKKLLTGELTSSAAESGQDNGVVSQPQENTSSESVSGEPVEETVLKAVTMPRDTMLDASKWEAFFKRTKSEGYTAVVVELKDEEGKIYFQSQAITDQCKRAVVSNAVSAAELAKKMKEFGLVPIAALYTFQDRTAPDKTKGNTFMIQNSTYTWFDNAADKGGKPWLNPYKEAARSYNTMIITETAKAGFEQLVLRSVQFPDVRSMDKADLDNTISIADILSQYVEEAKRAAQAAGAELMVEYPSTAYWKAATVAYGGEAGAIRADRIAPVFRLSDYGSKLTLGETVVENPGTETEAAVKAVVAEITKRTAGQKVEITPVIAAGQDTQAMVAALEAAGIQNYILAE